MFNSLFGIVELIGVIGLVRACIGLHSYCLTHKWLRHTSQVGAWTFALFYGGAMLILFYMAHLSANSIYLLFVGMSGGGGVLGAGIMLLTAVVLAHVIYGMVFVVPYLARGLALFSSGSTKNK